MKVGLAHPPLPYRFPASTVSKPVAARFSGGIQRTPHSFRLAWENPNVRPIIERSIIYGNFKTAPALGQQFINEIDRLCRQGLSDKAFYRSLEPFFHSLVQRKELQESFGTDKTERIQRRVRQIQSLLGGFKPGSMLDVGCGDGDITMALQNAYRLPKQSVTGLEVFIRPDAEESFQMEKFDGQSIPLPDQSQELVTLFAVIHHANEPEKLLNEIYRVLKPGGRLIVREFDAPSHDLKLFNLVMDDVLYEVYTPYPNVPIPGNYFSLDEWLGIFKKSGFGVESLMNASDLNEATNPYQPFMVSLKKPESRLSLVA